MNRRLRMKFREDMNPPLSPKAEEQPPQPQPQPVKVAPTSAEVVHEVDEVQPAPRPQQPEVIGKGTRRTDADGSQGYVNLYGQVVHQRPNILQPTKPAGPAEAPTKP